MNSQSPLSFHNDGGLLLRFKFPHFNYLLTELRQL